MPQIRLHTAVRRFLKWADANLAPRTVDVYRTYLDRFAKWAGDVPLATLSPALLTTWSRKFHPLQAVQRLTAWCHREERSIVSNPLERMRKAPTGQRRRVLTSAEGAAMLRGSDACFRRFLFALRESFARPQEIRAVRPIDVRQAGGIPADAAAIAGGRAFFLIDDGKGFNRRVDRSAERIIPISPRLGRLLLRLMRRRRSKNRPLFRNRLGRPWTANAVRCRLRRLRASLGFTADARGERVVAYSFRHTGATSAAAAGLRDWTLAAVLGHASTRTTARYVHLQAADVVDAMKRVWELNSSERAKIDRPGSLRKRSD